MRYFAVVMVVLATGLLPLQPASASNLKQFNTDIQAAFAHYRSALFYLRTGNEATGGLELDLFNEKWSAINKKWSTARPDAFADDQDWHKTLKAVGTLISKSLKALDGAGMKDARQTLLPIRKMLHELRTRNGVYIFSDCVEEMGGQIQALWAYRRNPPDFTSLEQLNSVKAKAAVYEFQIKKCRAQAPERYKTNSEFNRLFDGAENSVRTLWDATDKGQRRRFINILRELRPFDRLIFLRFG